MQAFKEFEAQSPEFWAFIKFVSEMLGYTVRGKGIIKTYSEAEIIQLCKTKNINIGTGEVKTALNYFNQRADLLNNSARNLLMDADEAKSRFNVLHKIHTKNGFTCKLPLNKQSGTKKQIAFFTAIINILTEKTLRDMSITKGSLGFDDDPRGLIYLTNNDNNIIGASSRRFDGAYPSIFDPKMVWEIKEYYYATTFGSRVADGVYETQLDGFEFKEIYNRTGKKVYHILFIDAYGTWWIQGKSYLCRIIDALNLGLVDEVIVGREVFSRWPEFLELHLL